VEEDKLVDAVTNWTLCELEASIGLRIEKCDPPYDPQLCSIANKIERERESSDHVKAAPLQGRPCDLRRRRPQMSSKLWLHPLW
jgi:hypothetical protein